jgi:hypothetical protein
MNKYNITYYKNNSIQDNNNNCIDDYDYFLFSYRRVNRMINNGYFGISLFIRPN